MGQKGIEHVGQFFLVQMLSVPKLDILDSGAPKAVEKPDDLLGLPADHNLMMTIRLMLAVMTVTRTSSQKSGFSASWRHCLQTRAALPR